jgi:predicted nucleic acid-binding protein
VIVADTGAILALIDASDRHHRKLRRLYEAKPTAWVLPWAILPEVDYLVGVHLGARAQQAFQDDIAIGAFAVEWGVQTDLVRARELNLRYESLKLGLVDGAVMAVAERLKAAAIATLDLRHFGAVTLIGAPALLPRDA